jgi:hypothetical protein
MNQGHESRAFGMNQEGGGLAATKEGGLAALKQAATSMNRARGRVQHDRHMRICQLVRHG